MHVCAYPAPSAPTFSKPSIVCIAFTSHLLLKDQARTLLQPHDLHHVFAVSGFMLISCVDELDIHLDIKAGMSGHQTSTDFPYSFSHYCILYCMVVPTHGEVDALCVPFPHVILVCMWFVVQFVV